MICITKTLSQQTKDLQCLTSWTIACAASLCEQIATEVANRIASVPEGGKRVAACFQEHHLEAHREQAEPQEDFRQEHSDSQRLQGLLDETACPDYSFQLYRQSFCRNHRDSYDKNRLKVAVVRRQALDPSMAMMPCWKTPVG